jgi:hypothetical protein
MYPVSQYHPGGGCLYFHNPIAFDTILSLIISLTPQLMKLHLLFIILVLRYDWLQENQRFNTTVPHLTQNIALNRMFKDRVWY